MLLDLLTKNQCSWGKSQNSNKSYGNDDADDDNLLVIISVIAMVMIKSDDYIPCLSDDKINYNDSHSNRDDEQCFWW